MCAPNKNIDVGLQVLAYVVAKTKYPHPIPLKWIAEICGCNRHSIENAEKLAIKKMRFRAKELYEKSCH